ncbi:hypothetical protein Trydic_g17611 [Trypoxylus dichotomus]
MSHLLYEPLIFFWTDLLLKKFEKLKPKKTNTQSELDICRTVIHVSTLQLSQEQTKVLAKGLNFAVAPTRIPKEEIITQAECAIQRLPAEEAEEIRHKTCRILQKAKPPARNNTKEERKALEDIRRNQNLIVVRADKGNATVVMDRQDYNMKIQMLLDTDHYKKLSKDPTMKVEKQTRDAIKESSIPKEEQRRLLPSESRPPRLYRLAKIHKPGNPLRPIILQHEIAKEDLLVSFDVESLFTNVPVEETLEIIKQQLIPKGLQPDLINLARLCHTSTYFLWNGEFYEQASGAAIGSPLSPFNESIVDFLERMKLAKSKVEVKIHTDPSLTSEQKRILISQNELNSLDILAANSDEGLRLVLDIKTPTTLSDASEIVTQHFHNDARIRNLSKRSHNPRQIDRSSYPQVTKQSSLHMNPNHRYVPPQPLVTPTHSNFYNSRQDIFTSYPNFSRPIMQNTLPSQPQFNRSHPSQGNFPSQPIPIQSRPVKQQFFTNRQVFGKPPSQKNVCAPKSNPGPRNFEPMDTSSARMNRSNNFFRRTAPRNFMSQELNSVEIYNEESCQNPNHNFAHDQNYETSPVNYINEHYYPEYPFSEHDNEPQYPDYLLTEYENEHGCSEYPISYPKDVRIEHTPDSIKSFDTCKNILSNDPILQYPDFNKPFNITTDASNVAIGAVLSQGSIGKDLPIAYASRTLNPAECNAAR